MKKLLSANGLIPHFAGLFSTVLLALTVAHCQITFQKTYGTPGYETNWCANIGYGTVQEVSDGGYIILGSGSKTIPEPRNMFLIRTNAWGDTLWTRIIGDTTSHEYGNSVLETYDGGFAMTFEGFSFAQPYHLGLIKTDNNGDTLWTKSFGFGTQGHAYSLKQTPDSGFIIAGIATSSITGWAMALVRTNKNGNILWGKTYRNWSNIYAEDVELSEDGGFLAVGNADNDAVILKVDANGNVLWSKTYDIANYGETFFNVKRLNNGYIICGETTSNANPDIFLVKTDFTGNVAWSKSYGGSGGEWSTSIQHSNDNGFVFAGLTQSFGNGGDAILIKIDSSGNLTWAKTFGGWGLEYANSVATTSDGGYILSGYGDSFGAGNSDMYIVKTDNNGNCSCYNSNPNILTNILSPTTVSANVYFGDNLLQSTYPAPIKKGLIVTTVCNNLGIEDMPVENSILIFPNPFSTQTTLHTDNLLHNATLTVYNCFGQQVKQFVISRNEFGTGSNSDTFVIRRDNLPSGLYFIRLTEGNKIIAADKLVITDK